MTLGRTSGETPCGSVFSFTVYCQVGQGLVNFGSEAIFQTESGKKICINRASLCDQRSVVSETHHLESIALLCNSINSGVTCYHMQMSESEQKKSAVRFVRVEPGYEGQRIDNFLLNVLKGVPKSYVYRIIRRGEVRVNKGENRLDIVFRRMILCGFRPSGWLIGKM